MMVSGPPATVPNCSVCAVTAGVVGKPPGPPTTSPVVPGAAITTVPAGAASEPPAPKAGLASINVSVCPLPTETAPAIVSGWLSASEKAPVVVKVFRAVMALLAPRRADPADPPSELPLIVPAGVWVIAPDAFSVTAPPASAACSARSPVTVRPIAAASDTVPVTVSVWPVCRENPPALLKPLRAGDRVGAAVQRHRRVRMSADRDRARDAAAGLVDHARAPPRS